MIWDDRSREARLYNVVQVPDQRRQFERDRDRVLYSSAFHRLAGITQVVRVGEEDVFHTRQQHSYKVAQIGRRLAQKCIREQDDIARKFGVDEEVVEAACLAHDLGHPPFGHHGEQILDELLTGECNDYDGFEGNAQSFRIVTKLSVRFAQIYGHDLTRATLAACLKYPWVRDKDNPSRSKKWSVYRLEEKEFRFAREHFDHDIPSAEASIMDCADDIAYSVHDLEDFHRCRAIPWHQILMDNSCRDNIIDRAIDDWYERPGDAREKLTAAFDDLTELSGGFEPLFYEQYDGTRPQRQMLRTLTSGLISRFVQKVTLRAVDGVAEIAEEEAILIRLLKQITRDYIISTPNLCAQQRGYGNIIRFIFREITSSVDSRAPRVPDFLPSRVHYLWGISERSPGRFAADCIASLTERETLALYARLSGTSGGSVLDPIVR